MNMPHVILIPSIPLYFLKNLITYDIALRSAFERSHILYSYDNTTEMHIVIFMPCFENEMFAMQFNSSYVNGEKFLLLDSRDYLADIAR